MENKCTESFANTNLLDNENLRNTLIGRIDVLEKVKHLLLIPEMECMTIRQVAEYYEVDFESIRKCYSRNKEEIDLDGVSFETPVNLKKIFNGTSCPIKDWEQKHGKLIVHIDDSTTIEIPNRGIKMFSKRAVLRIGMLLRDSVIAKEVRSQLLNIYEAAQNKSPALVTKEIEAEENLLHWRWLKPT